MNKNITRKLIYSSLFSTLIFIGTQFIKIPLIIGYLNVGDCFVLLSGWILGGGWAMIGAGIGAGFADLLSGYAIYTPVTMIIKAMMALVAFKGRKMVEKKRKFILIGYIISGIIAESIMVVGYGLFEVFLYGFEMASVAFVGNLLQGVIAIATSLFLIGVLENTKLIKKIRKDNF